MKANKMAIKPLRQKTRDTPPSPDPSLLLFPQHNPEQKVWRSRDVLTRHVLIDSSLPVGRFCGVLVSVRIIRV